MQRIWTIVIVAALSLGGAPALFAQQPGQELEAELAERGLEAVRVAPGSGGPVVAFENRRYRYDVRALREVAAAAGPSAVVVPYRRGWPLMALAPGPDGSLRVVDSAPARVGGRPLNPSAWTLDLVLRPQVAFEFGNFADPVESQLNLMPEADLRLWRGARVLAQLIVPIQNELDEAGDDVRPGLLTASQVWRFPEGIWASATAGYFSQRRYGIDLEALRFFWNGRIGLGGRLGYTGFAAYANEEWLYDDLDTVTWTAYATVAVWPELGLAVQPAVGRFLDGDVGVQVDVRRAFGEVEVAFRGVHTEHGTDAGFSLVVPLPGSRHLEPMRVRPRLAEELAWTYWYRALPDAGRMYRTGQSLGELWGELHPAYLQARLQRGR